MSSENTSSLLNSRTRSGPTTQQPAGAVALLDGPICGTAEEAVMEAIQVAMQRIKAITTRVDQLTADPATAAAMRAGIVEAPSRQRRQGQALDKSVPVCQANNIPVQVQEGRESLAAEEASNAALAEQIEAEVRAEKQRHSQHMASLAARQQELRAEGEAKAKAGATSQACKVEEVLLKLEKQVQAAQSELDQVTAKYHDRMMELEAALRARDAAVAAREELSVQLEALLAERDSAVGQFEGVKQQLGFAQAAASAASAAAALQLQQQRDELSAQLEAALAERDSAVGQAIGANRTLVVSSVFAMIVLVIAAALVALWTYS